MAKKKLFGMGDIRMLTVNNHYKGAWIPPNEMQEVLHLVPDATYVLYTVYRAFPFKESLEIEDGQIAKLLGWSARKVRDHRLVLEKADLLLIERVGTKLDGFTRVFVGLDTVALRKAGLPPEILDGSALNKIKKKLNINNSVELVRNVINVVTEYDSNPELYK
jgi:hypothetical protein